MVRRKGRQCAVSGARSGEEKVAARFRGEAFPRPAGPIALRTRSWPRLTTPFALDKSTVLPTRGKSVVGKARVEPFGLFLPVASAIVVSLRAVEPQSVD